MNRPEAAVLTVSDGVAEGVRDDASGRAVAETLEAGGYRVALREVVPDDRPRIEAALRRLAGRCRLVVTTGGTGLGPRDVTPEATLAVLDRQAPGLAEAMRATGRASTPLADLSRGVAGTIGGALVVNLPGGSRGARESLGAVLPVLRHAVEILAGHTAHGPADQTPATAAEDRPVVVALAVRVHGTPPCRPGQKLVIGPSGPIEGTLGCAEFDSGALADAPAVLAAGEPATRTYEHGLGSVEVFLQPRGPRPTLIVLGATPVGRWLLRWGRDLGYVTVLVEPRTDRVTAEDKELAGRVEAEVGALELSGEVDAVHTDHDAPRLVDHVAALLREPVRFVGVMGSARHAGPHLEALRRAGLPEEDVARVRTPVGLDIGSRSPQEIALSILAGLVAARARRPGGWLDVGGPG
jgi:molybdenum cofactor synthesis domain-containing protein